MVDQHRPEIAALLKAKEDLFARKPLDTRGISEAARASIPGAVVAKNHHLEQKRATEEYHQGLVTENAALHRDGPLHLQQALQQKDERFHTLTQQLAEKGQEHATTIKRYQRQAQQQNELIKQKDERFNALEKRNAELVEDIKTSAQAKVEADEALRNQMVHKDSRITAQGQTIMEMKGSIKSKDDDNHDLCQTVEELRRQIKSLASETDALRQHGPESMQLQLRTLQGQLDEKNGLLQAQESVTEPDSHREPTESMRKQRPLSQLDDEVGIHSTSQHGLKRKRSQAVTSSQDLRGPKRRQRTPTSAGDQFGVDHEASFGSSAPASSRTLGTPFLSASSHIQRQESTPSAGLRSTAVSQGDQDSVIPTSAQMVYTPSTPSQQGYSQPDSTQQDLTQVDVGEDDEVRAEAFLSEHDIKMVLVKRIAEDGQLVGDPCDISDLFPVIKVSAAKTLGNIIRKSPSTWRGRIHHHIWCLSGFETNSNRCWVKGYVRKFACRSCTNKGKPCMVADEEGTINVLPLPPSLRTCGPDEQDFYIDPDLEERRRRSRPGKKDDPGPWERKPTTASM